MQSNLFRCVSNFKLILLCKEILPMFDSLSAVCLSFSLHYAAKYRFMIVISHLPLILKHSTLSPVFLRDPQTAFSHRKNSV